MSIELDSTWRLLHYWAILFPTLFFEARNYAGNVVLRTWFRRTPKRFQCNLNLEPLEGACVPLAE